jgi:flavin reductase (DIM6/NTAB) family NADH-FMN oxidoreductase RutF
MQPTWQTAFSQMTYGIYVLTTQHETIINGMIASWVSQVSYDPPLIMAALHPNRFSQNLVEKSGHFALHVIAESQKSLIDKFMGPDPSGKFTDIDWQTGETGCPVLKNCLAWFECRIEETHQPGNHCLFIGKVVSAGCNDEARSLCTQDYDAVYTGRG